MKKLSNYQGIEGIRVMASKLVDFTCTVTKPLLNFLTWLTPLFAFIARVWVGYVFLKAGLLKLESWQSTVMLFTHEFQVPLLPPYFAAILGTAAEIALPILVILGLGGRLIVALLFLFNLIAVISYPHLWTPDGFAGLKQHIEWGVILMLLMGYGTGKWTLDYFILKRCGCNNAPIDQLKHKAD